MTEGGKRVSVAVIGAGAAGLMAAVWAARSGEPVVLLERTPDGGRKILISGGGRCNLLPAVERPRDFVTDSSSNLLRRLLRAWPLSEQRAFFERLLRGPLRYEPEAEKLFPPTQRARDVRDALVEAAINAGARVWFDAMVTELAPEPRGWRVSIAGAPDLRARAVILATGGLSVPQTGSDGFGLRWCESHDHTLHPRYPALTPLTGTSPAHAALAGVSLPVEIRTGKSRDSASSTGGFLFTHRGWSGPAVLDVSHVVTRWRDDAQGDPPLLHVRWGQAQMDWEAVLGGGAGTVARAVSRHLPERLGRMLLDEAGVPAGTPLGQLRRDDRRALIAALTAYSLPWKGDEGYKKAEVTGGGVALSEVRSRSLESRRQPGLFLCGELLDAFGPIGGHNFQWAWSTGRAAGLGAVAYVRDQQAPQEQ